MVGSSKRLWLIQMKIAFLLASLLSTAVATPEPLYNIGAIPRLLKDVDGPETPDSCTAVVTEDLEHILQSKFNLKTLILNHMY